MSDSLEADVCVIGAGAGGAVAAAELAEGGARVVLLEQGPEHDPDSFSARPLEMLGSLYRDGGQTATLGVPPILLPLGRGLGGTTLVNSGTCFRAPQPLLERWRREHGLELDGPALEHCYERVEHALSVAEVTPELAGANAAIARRGAGAARMVPRLPAPQRPRLRRLGRLRLRLSHLRQAAHRHHLSAPRPRRRRTGLHGGRRAAHPRRRRACTRAQARLAGRRALEVRAARVVLAAGTIHTPLLLARSGLGRDSGQLGRNLVLHPATAAFALMDEVVDMARGVPQSFYIDEFAAQGILFESVAGPPAYVALALPLTGARHAAAMLATGTSPSSG